jgi:hypothetical protein
MMPPQTAAPLFLRVRRLRRLRSQFFWGIYQNQVLRVKMAQYRKRMVVEFLFSSGEKESPFTV